MHTLNASNHPLLPELKPPLPSFLPSPSVSSKRRNSTVRETNSLVSSDSFVSHCLQRRSHSSLPPIEPETSQGCVVGAACRKGFGGLCSGCLVQLSWSLGPKLALGLLIRSFGWVRWASVILQEVQLHHGSNHWFFSHISSNIVPRFPTQHAGSVFLSKSCLLLARYDWCRNR